MKKVSGWKTPKCLGKCEFHKVGGSQTCVEREAVEHNYGGLQVFS